MRNLNGSALNKIAQQYGNEAITILDIQWGGGISQYSDRDIVGINGKILEISNLDAVIDVFNNSDSQELNITLDDNNGTIKEIMDNFDIHMKNVWVYQWFEGLNLNDRFLLFKGKINSPITWHEGDRTVSFTILAQIEDNEVGFAPEEGMIENLPQSLVDQPWPSVFGTVTLSKTLRLTESVRGTTADGVGFPDFCLGARYNALMQISSYITYVFTPSELNPHLQQALKIAQDMNKQEATARSTVRIFGGEDFPRGNITILLGNTPLTGHFGNSTATKDIFYIDGGSTSQHPARDEFQSGVHFTTEQERYSGEGKIIPYAIGMHFSQMGRRWFVPTGEVAGDNAGYVYIAPGTTVKIATTEPQKYVVSITPGEVLRVAAWAMKDGQRFIQDVPTNWYTVTVETFGPISATIIVLTDSLSKKDDMGFEDEIYVTFKSTIGPNTVDILEYIITTYTDFTINTGGFSHVKTCLENYPSHFALYEKKNVVSVLQEIAWQARCAIHLKNEIFYLIYLPESVATDAIIRKQDILLDTFELGHTPTEDLVTKMVCSWTATGMQEEEFRTILRHNVIKYGLHEQSYDYYIYDFVDAVVKSATFWLIRYANTWKKVNFQVPLTLLNLETFDFVTLEIDNLIANENIRAMIEQAQYDSENNTIDIECWCPVKAGTMTTYDFAYPAAQPTWKTFPTDYETEQGYAGGNSPGKKATGSL